MYELKCGRALGCSANPAMLWGLLLLQASFSNGDQVLSDWMVDTSICSWTGVICQDGQVVGL